MSGKTKKMRLDQLVLAKRPDLSRSRVQAEIMAGRVMVDGKICDKAGMQVPESADLSIMGPANPYVSRGGLKLEGALKDLSVEVEEKVVLDVGASTGGFTDCLLQKGASFVYALDVGYGQLDWKLRERSDVAVLERFNVRKLKAEDLENPPDLAVVDVSFISLALVIPVLAELKIEEVLLLVKPQFEAGRSEADRGGGVIRSPEIHRAVLVKMCEHLIDSGYSIKGLAFSRLTGPSGNIEFFLYAAKSGEAALSRDHLADKITATVNRAHDKLVFS